MHLVGLISPLNLWLSLNIVGRDSSVGIASGYGLDSPGIESWWGGEIFLTRPNRSWGPPNLLFKGGLVHLPVVKRPECCVNHTPSSIAKVKEGVELFLWVSWPVPGWTLLLDLPFPLSCSIEYRFPVTDLIFTKGVVNFPIKLAFVVLTRIYLNLFYKMG